MNSDATSSRKSNPIPLLRHLAIIEGLSFLVLLFVAMPLKYAAGMPVAVRVVGLVHGVLFIALCVILVRTTIVARWKMGRAALVFLAALLPFGPFLIDRRMKAFEEEYQAASTSS
jgi:integral membrane protein